MKRALFFFFLASFSASFIYANTAWIPCERGRLFILADMGNEPDEEQQMMHMLMCCNTFDVEGLIAVTGKYLRPESKNAYKQKLHPELFDKLIEGYSKVYPNLLKHDPNYPKPSYLSALVSTGQTGYGMEATGEGKTSEGSSLLTQAILKDDTRPLYVVVNAGSNTLAQAIKDYALDHSTKEVKNFIRKVIVYENGAQDNSGAWICANYPNINWIRSNYQAYCYGGPGKDGAKNNDGRVQDLGPYKWEPYPYSSLGQHQWLLENVISGHGPFGVYYPLRQFPNGHISFMEGGGTIPWLCLVNIGLSNIKHMNWGGWSGRYSKTKVKNYWSKHSDIKIDEEKVAPFYMYDEELDVWTDPENGKRHVGIFTPVWRWRRAYLNDFKCRMDWCTQSYKNANHHPVAALNENKSNDMMLLTVKAGESISLDATLSTDPDQDSLSYSWYMYNEPGNYNKNIFIANQQDAKATIDIPMDASKSEIHIILEVSDNNAIAKLWDYRRIIIRVK